MIWTAWDYKDDCKLVKTGKELGASAADALFHLAFQE